MAAIRKLKVDGALEHLRDNFEALSQIDPDYVMSDLFERVRKQIAHVFVFDRKQTTLVLQPISGTLILIDLVYSRKPGALIRNFEALMELGTVFGAANFVCSTRKPGMERLFIRYGFTTPDGELFYIPVREPDGR